MGYLMKKFSEYVFEQTNGKTATIVWGRMNPPTRDHGKLLSKAGSVQGDLFVYLSQNSGSKKNPLDYQTKIKYARKMFPKYARNIHIDPNIKTPFDLLVKIFEKSYTKISIVTGSDRVTEYETLFEKYNGQKGRHGFYQFETISVVSMGERDPDSEGSSGNSASKLRSYAESNDFISFKSGLPSDFKEAQELFNDIRKGLGLKESTSFRQHVKLEKISQYREKYLEGSLFSEGDQVVITESSEIGRIDFLGSNYVIVKGEDGKKYRKWITDVELVS